jgi:integrase/recombinase XerC
LPEPTVRAVKRWLAVRPQGATQAVFTNFDRAKKGDGRITRFGVYKVVRWLGEQVNLKARPHGIRHDALTAAVKLAQEHGIELPSVLKFSRHKDLATLMVYLDLIQNRQGEIAALVAGSLGKRKRKAL